jgi:hypothetical protein
VLGGPGRVLPAILPTGGLRSDITAHCPASALHVAVSASTQLASYIANILTVCLQVISERLNATVTHVLTAAKLLQAGDAPATTRIIGRRYFCSLKEVGGSIAGVMKQWLAGAPVCATPRMGLSIDADECLLLFPASTTAGGQGRVLCPPHHCGP